MRFKPLIPTAGSMKADGRITNCISGRCMKGCAGHQPRYCLKTSVDGWLPLVCRFGVLLPGCEPYIRNGLVTPTLDGATATRSTLPGANAAKSMSGTYETAPMPICAMSPPSEARRCVCGAG